MGSAHSVVDTPPFPVLEVKAYETDSDDPSSESLRVVYEDFGESINISNENWLDICVENDYEELKTYLYDYVVENLDFAEVILIETHLYSPEKEEYFSIMADNPTSISSLDLILNNAISVFLNLKSALG